MVFFFVFFLTILLYYFKIIGGSDGKLLIFIFITMPFIESHFNFFSLYFFLFSLLYFGMLSLNFAINSSIRSKDVFHMLFSLDLKLSFLKKFYIKSFYRFSDFSKLKKYKDSKYRLMSISLFYNANFGKFNLLTQFRPPLIFLCVISYYTLHLWKILLIV